ncbi:hypothetical protein [Micromonospora sp. CNB394]|uniref:hypothetical protein n=1 Tax=Micromonospora sp. CNB394 TaxID=1169151 RepID=UPI00036EAA32|nr:hypothetical protein [Micromonospora sp. CNB394]
MQLRRLPFGEHVQVPVEPAETRPQRHREREERHAADHREVREGVREQQPHPGHGESRNAEQEQHRDAGDQNAPANPGPAGSSDRPSRAVYCRRVSRAASR